MSEVNQNKKKKIKNLFFENINSTNYNKVIKNIKLSNEMIKQKYQNIIIENNNYH